MNKRSQGGQSLVEILIGLGVVSIMIGASSYALVTVLRSSTVTEQNQSAGLIGNSLLESASVLAEGNWNTVYNLTKSSANHYFIVNSPTTTPYAIAGDESVLSENITNGLVGHWKFDESSANTSWAYDSSGQGNFGALTNGPTRTVSASCKVGACLSFDGANQTVSIPHSATLKPVDQITISAWVKPTDITTNVFYEIYRKEDGTPRHLLSFQNNGTILSFGIATGDVYAELDVPITASQYTDSNWHYIVATYDGATKRIFKDGVLIGSATATGAIGATGTANAYIGSSAGTGEFFNGLIDEVRIYNRALSATEISQLYNSPVYSRYFYVDNVKRTICGTGNITADAESTCLGASGVSQDPATQKITVGTSWDLKGVSDTVENSVYVTRWINSVSGQSDWGGNSGTAGPVSEFGTDYFEYSGISTTTSGFIKVAGI